MKRMFFLSLMFSIGIGGRGAWGQNITWTGNTSTDWATGLNWLGGAAPANDLVTNIAQFNTGVGFTTNVTVGSARSVAGINITSNFTGALNLSGNPLSLGASGITLAAGLLSLNNNTVVAASQTWTNTGNNLSVVGNVTLSANQTLTLSGNGSTTSVSGAISDAGSSSPGNLVINLTDSTKAVYLSSTNSTYTGQTTIQAGTLGVSTIADAGMASSLGAATGANAVININSGAALTINTGASNRTINMYGGAGNVTLSASGGSSAWAPVTLNGPITASGDAAHTLILYCSNFATNTLSGVIPDAASNPTSLTKTGSFFWALTGLNTYTGPTVIQSGTLMANTLADAGVPSSLGAASGANAVIQMSTASQLIYTGTGASSNRPLNLTSSSTSGSNYIIDSAGTGPLTLTGNITSQAQVVSPYRDTLYLCATSRQTNIFSGALVDSTTGNITYLEKSGPGTWVLSGANTYSGYTTVQAGALVLDLSVKPEGVINPVSNLYLGGYINTSLTVKGNSTGNSSQTMGNLALNDGAQTLSVNPNGGTGTTLTMTGTWTASSGSALNLLLPANAAVAGNPTLSSNLITDASSGRVFAVVNSNNFATITGGQVAEYTGYTALANNSNNATINYQVTGSLTHNGGAWAMNVLKIAPATAGTLNLGGSTASLSGQAVLFTGNQNFAISSGTLGAASKTLLVDQYGSGVLTISSALGGGTTNLTKAGPGPLVLTSTNNSYTGETGIYGGILSVYKLANGGVNSSIGASNSSYQNLILDGGTLQYLGAGDSSDRGFSVGFNGGTIDASGTGPLNLTSTSAYPSQPITTYTPGLTTLTLAGNNTGSNILANRLFDSTTNSLKGALALTKAGSGAWTLTNNTVNTYQGNTVYGSTYTGATSIVGGALVQAATNAISPYSNTVFNGGVLGLAAGNYTLSLGTGAGQAQFAGSGGFAAFGANRTVNIGGALATMTWGTGNFIPGGSSLILGYASANATVTFQNPLDLNGADRTIQTDRGTGSPDAIISGAIGNSSGTAGIVKTGSGVLALTAANTYNGPTDIDGGVLIQSNANAIPVASNINFNGGVLGLGVGNFTHSLGTGGGQVQFTGNGGFAAYGGNRTVNLGGNSAMVTWGTGGFVPDGSSLILGASTSANTVTFQNPIDLGGLTRTIQVVRGSGSPDAVISGGISGSGGLTKTDTGILTLTGTNTYTGGTNLNGGIIQVGSDANLGAVTGGVRFDGGTLQWTASFNLSATRNLTLNTGGGTLDTNGFNATVPGNISGAGSLTKTDSGTLTLSGNNTYGGSTTVNGGSLQLGATTGLPSQTAVTLNGTGANTLNLNGYNTVIGSLSGTGGVSLGSGNLTVGGNNSSTTYSGNITGSGGLTKTGSGNLTLSGNNTFTGATNVSQGVLKVTGYINNSTGIVVQPAATFDYENAAMALTAAITNNNGGTVIIGSGVTVRVAGGSSLAGYQSTSTGGLGSQLSLLDGTAGANRDLTPTWRNRNANEAYPTQTTPPVPAGSFGLISDVVNFTGTGSDLYTLQLSYDPGQIRPGLNESQLVSARLLYLAYNSSGLYVNAGTHFVRNGAYNPATDFVLGNWGVDSTYHVAWAVVNHNSEWGVVPEPGTLGLLVLGSLSVMKARRRKKA